MPQAQQGYMDYVNKRAFAIKKRASNDDEDDFYEISF